MNILIPICVGAVLYYLFCPGVSFVLILDCIGQKFFGSEFNGLHVDYIDSYLFLIIRYYLFDMLWAYSLTFTVFYILPRKKKLISAFIVMFFTLLMELLQISDYISGTFDFFDIFAELIAATVAYMFIKKIDNRRVK